MNNVQKRHVFYLSGFDPRGASFYHRLFKEEAQKQSKLNKIKVNIGARKKQSQYAQSWAIEALDEGQAVSTHYEFLRWDDIIRQHWVKSFWSIFIDFLYVSWVYITTGTLKRVAQASRTPAITGLYPAVYIAVSGILAILLCYASLAIFSAFNLSWVGWIIGLALFTAFIYSAKLVGDRINVFWLLRIYAFTARWAAGDIKSIDKRITLFADKIFDTLRNNQQDEVIIISHSVGTMLAVAIAARVAHQLDRHQVKQSLNMITLGECIPLLSLLPKAQAMKEDLAYLSAAENIYWIDYTSPADGACFPLVDPVKISISEQQYKSSPLLLSTRFYKLYTDAHYQTIRRNFYKMHFLYLMSHDYLGEYDLFAIIAGKYFLKDRIQQK